MPRKFAIIGGLLLLVVSVVPVFANHAQEVLGDQTTSSNVNFPPVASGPGYFLPDSPLYIVDKAFQGMRLAFSFTPERRVVIRDLILGERLAELRVMAERNNTAAMQVTLSEIAHESGKISTDLADAAAQGKDVKTLAKDTNDLMKLQREILKTVGEQVDSALALQVESTRQSLLLAKVRVEDQLTEQEMLEAMENDLEDEVETQVLGVQTAVSKLEQRLLKLDTMIKKDEGKLETEADEDIKSEILKLKVERLKILNDIKKKKKALQEERKSKMQQLREQAKKMRESIMQFRNARKAEKAGNLTPTPTTTITPSPQASPSNQ